MIQYGKQLIDNKDIKSVSQVMSSPFLTQGPKIKQFEQALTRYTGAKYAVASNNGTSALHLAYMAAGISQGDQVITTPNTYVATTNMLLAQGTRPKFCDICPDSWNIDEAKIEKLVTSKTKAIVPVHFCGHPCEMDKISQIAAKHKLVVIEDASHALGAKFKRSKIGDCHYSDMATFSFHPVKPITTAEGGAVLTNSKKYYQKLLLLRNHGTLKDKQGRNIMTCLGFNYRLTELAAALGISQLKKLDSFIKKRHQVAGWYNQQLEKFPHIILPVELPHVYSGWHLYVILTKRPGDRDKLRNYLKDHNIGVNFHYPAVYSHPYYRKNGFKNFKLPNAEVYQKSCITLPCHTGLSKREVAYVCQVIKQFYKKND